MSDLLKTKIENPDVRAYIYKMVPKELNSNPLFVKLFGKDFARKRLKSNALIVYTNEAIGKNNAKGYQCTSDKSITLCSAGTDGGVLTPGDIENNPQLKEATLHESIHAIFSRTKEECLRLGCVGGTGVLQIKQVYGTDILYEIGRGLNEGYTEWMCEKAGHKSCAYGTLTNFIYLLEAARGTENIMALGNGNIEKLLDLPKEDVNVILATADSVYKVGEKISLHKNIANSIDRDNENLSDEEKKRRAELYTQLLPEIEKIRNDVAFLSWTKEKNKSTSDNSIHEYINEVSIPDYFHSMDILTVRFESFVLEKYFLHDLNSVFKSTPIDENNINKVEKIISLLNSRNIGTKAHELCEGMTSIEVITRYKELKDKYIKQVAIEEAEKYNSRSTSTKRLYKKNLTLCR